MNFNTVNFGFLRVLRELHEFWRSFFVHLHDHIFPHHRNNYRPHILSGRTLVLLALLLVSIKLFSVASLSFNLVSLGGPVNVNPANIINLTNQVRQQFRLNSLKENSVLTRAAQAKAQDMLTKGYFAHNSPEGKTPWEFLDSVGYNYFAAGENLAINFVDANSLEQAWMSSPSHKANILKSDFEEIGIGVAEGEYFGKKAIFVVQMFGIPSEQKIKLLEIPTVVEKNDLPIPEKVTLGLNVESSSLEQPEIIPVSGNRIKVKIQAPSDAVKVLANFGEKSAMLNPKPGNIWEAFIDLEKLAENNGPLKVAVFNFNNQKQNFDLASFGQGQFFGGKVLGDTVGSLVELKDNSIQGSSLQDKDIYLWFVFVLLSCLILAIAIHPKIQHVGMILNSSLVIIFAVMLWAGG